MKVLLADDHRIVREGLKSLLQSQPDLEVIAEASDGRQAVEMARDLSPDVVVMDVAMPQLNGIEATRQLANDQRDMKIVALSMHSDRRYVSEALKAGASGYVLKDGAFDELISAIRAVVSNRVYLSPRVAGVVVEDYVRRLPTRDGSTHAAEEPAHGRRSAFDALTPREREVLQLMAEGRSNAGIARQLVVTDGTVQKHIGHILGKMRLSETEDDHRRVLAVVKFLQAQTGPSS